MQFWAFCKVLNVLVAWLTSEIIVIESSIKSFCTLESCDIWALALAIVLASALLMCCEEQCVSSILAMCFPVIISFVCENNFLITVLFDSMNQSLSLMEFLRSYHLFVFPLTVQNFVFWDSFIRHTFLWKNV